MVDAEAVILAELERLAPAADTVPADWGEVRRRSEGPAAPRRLRPALVVIAAALLLAGVATATYLALHAAAVHAVNGPVVIASQKHEVTVLRAVGADGRLRAIWTCPHRTFCGALEDQAWSPDGTRLALAVYAVGLPTPYYGLDVANVATGKLTHLTTGRGSCSADFGQPNGVDWSPDGRWLAFTCDSSRILVISPRGTQQRPIATGLQHVTSPSWSPDGRRLVFAAGTAGRSSIYVIDADGGNRRLLVQHGRAPAWSPAGDVIAYRRPSQGPACGGLRLVTAEGRDATPATATAPCFQLGPRESGAPEWSPDGTQLAVAASDGVYVLKADGTNLHRITPAGAYSGRPAWQPLHNRPPTTYHARTTNCPSC